VEEIITTVYGLLASNIGGIVGICILLAFVGILNKIKKDLIGKFIAVAKVANGHHHETTVKMSIACDRDINMELSRLLFGAKASRVGLFLFHNGAVFSTNNPIWKISGTHERCEPGTTQEFHNVQDVKASLLTPLISPMFTGVDTDGIMNVTPARCPITGVKCARSNAIYRVDPDAVANNFTQTFLNNRGTRFGVLAPLQDWNNAVVGFVLVEYCHDGFLTDEDLMANTHLACKTTSRIYQLISELEPDDILDATSTSLGKPKKKKPKK
jgi:hypothetical protein